MELEKQAKGIWKVTAGEPEKHTPGIASEVFGSNAAA